MGAEQSTPTTETSATHVVPDEIVDAPAAAPIGKIQLPLAAEKTITVSLSEVNIVNDTHQRVGQKRPGERPALGGINSPSDEGALSQASTRSSVPLSFRFSKQKRQERVGVSLHSGEDCDGVVITGLQDGAIRGKGARPGDRIVSINGVAISTATQAGEVLRKVVGDCEVVVERIEEEDEAALAA